MFTHVLVAVDGSDHAQAAIDYGSAIADKFDAKLTLLHIVSGHVLGGVPEQLSEYARAEHIQLGANDALLGLGREILTHAVERAQCKRAGHVESATEIGDPAQTICDYADNHEADLIVMGRRGLGDLAGLLLGSVSHKVSHLSKCACMTVV